MKNDNNILFLNIFYQLKNKIYKLRHFIKKSNMTGMIVLAALIGVVGGLGAVGFHYLISILKNIFWGAGAGESFLPAVRALPWYYRIGIPALGGLIIGPLISFIVQEAKGHGVPEVMEAVGLNSGIIRVRVAPLKALISAITISSGGSAGREGPIVQIGAGFGSAVGQFFKLNSEKVETLLAAGAAAGIGGTFNAPLAGVMFSLEVLLKNIKLTSFSPIVVASVAGTGVANLFFTGRTAIFDIPVFEIVSIWEIIFYLGLGIAAALVALLFENSLYSMEHIFEKLYFPKFLKPALGGLFLGLLAFLIPEIHSTGYPVMESALHGNLSLQIVLILMFGKILATNFTLGSGGSGGIFAPSLFIGAMMGSSFGMLVNIIFPNISAGPSAYGMVGMGAVFAGAAHAPLTSIIILFEMTRDPKIFLPLMFACVISTVLTTLIQKRNIYTTKLLNRGVDIEAIGEAGILKNIKVKDVMSTELIALLETDTIEKANRLFKKVFHSYLPVVKNENNKFISMISYREVLNYLEEKKGNQKIENFITPSSISLNEEDNLLKAMELMNNIKIKTVPVLDSKGEKLIGLISRSDILEAYYSKITTNTQNDTILNYSQKVSVEVDDLINFAIDNIKNQAEKEKIKIKKELENDLPSVIANASKISWVLTNLLGNALRYSNKGDEIIIFAKSKEEKDQVLIGVKDHGPGIPEKYQKKIFEKFVQLSDKSEVGGLGLAISKEIIEAHDGNIWVESEVGEGATFTISLNAFYNSKLEVN